MLHTARELPPPAVDEKPWEGLRTNVRALLRRHLKEGYSGLLGQEYCYIRPAPGRYPFQWFWDTCFHIFILLHLGEHDIAKRGLRSLFAMQRADGFVGHMIFWKQVLPGRPTDIVQARPSWQDLRPHTSELVQPPFVAQALERIYAATRDRVYLGELYAPIRGYHGWLAQKRDFHGDGLLSIISPFESGMDWKPSYDPVVGHRRRRTPRHLYTSRYFWQVVSVDWHNFVRRYDLERIRQRSRFLVKDVGFNTAYALDLAAMERLAPITGDDPAPYRQRRERVARAIVEKMYDDEAAAFFDLHEPGGRPLRILTPSIFFPLALDEVDDATVERVMHAHFANEREFAAALPLPTVALCDPSFYAGETPYIWRGPMWAFPNWFLYHALKRRGYESQARRLRRALWRAVKQSGFREYYNPFTGEGYGARDFTWSGLLLDMR
jgi:glycogen debranching enzyme